MLVDGIGKPIDEITGEDIERFLDARDIQPRTRYCWLSHVSCFYQWAQRNERLISNPAARLQRPKLRRLVPDPTPEDEVAAALATAPPLVRQWVLVMAYAGLRCCEVARLRGEDIDRSAQTLRVFGKGDKWRVVPLHRVVAAELEHAAGRAGWVWVNPGSGCPYTAQQVSSIVGAHMRRIGVSHTRAHRLRHRFATALLDAGADIAVVAELLGHESIETTRGYAAVSMRHLRSAVALIA